MEIEVVEPSLKFSKENYPRITALLDKFSRVYLGSFLTKDELEELESLLIDLQYSVEKKELLQKEITLWNNRLFGALTNRADFSDYLFEWIKLRFNDVCKYKPMKTEGVDFERIQQEKTRKEMFVMLWLYISKISTNFDLPPPPISINVITENWMKRMCTIYDKFIADETNNMQNGIPTNTTGTLFPVKDSNILLQLLKHIIDSHDIDNELFPFRYGLDSLKLLNKANKKIMETMEKTYLKKVVSRKAARRLVVIVEYYSAVLLSYCNIVRGKDPEKVYYFSISTKKLSTSQTFHNLEISYTDDAFAVFDTQGLITYRHIIQSKGFLALFVQNWILNELMNFRKDGISVLPLNFSSMRDFRERFIQTCRFPCIKKMEFSTKSNVVIKISSRAQPIVKYRRLNVNVISPFDLNSRTHFDYNLYEQMNFDPPANPIENKCVTQIETDKLTSVEDTVKYFIKQGVYTDSNKVIRHTSNLVLLNRAITLSESFCFFTFYYGMPEGITFTGFNRIIRMDPEEMRRVKLGYENFVKTFY